MNKLHAGIFLALFLVNILPANASVPLGGNRKGTSGSYDMYGCMQSNDYYVVNFAAYQIDPSQVENAKTLPEAECINLPMTGKIQISVDLLDLDVRKKPVALRILNESDKTIAEIPMAIVKQGVLSTTVDFATTGKYTAVLTVDDNDLHTPLPVSALNIPLTVAVPGNQTVQGNGLLIFIILIVSLIAVSAYYVPRWLKPDPTH